MEILKENTNYELNELNNKKFASKGEALDLIKVNSSVEALKRQQKASLLKIKHFQSQIVRLEKHRNDKKKCRLEREREIKKETDEMKCRKL